MAGAWGCAALLALAGAARAEVPCQEIGLVATPLPSGDSGIGGTGRGDDSGIGGTGIYGSITSLHSLCVNGLLVHHENAEIRVNYWPADAEALALGKVVWILANVREGRLHAETIWVLSAVVGPITGMDADARTVEVQGLTVRVRPDAIVVEDRGARIPDLASLAIGDVLDVSGLPLPGGEIAASRVQRSVASMSAWRGPAMADLLRGAPGMHTLSIEGYVQALGPGSFRIAGLEVDLAQAQALPSFAVGAPVRVRASVLGGALIRADQITVRPPPPLPPSPMPAPLPDAPVSPPPLGISDDPRLFEPRPLEPVPVPIAPPVPAPEPEPVAPQPVIEPVEEPVREISPISP